MYTVFYYTVVLNISLPSIKIRIILKARKAVVVSVPRCSPRYANTIEVQFYYIHL